MPVIALVAVVTLAVVGRAASSSPSERPEASVAAFAEATTLRTPLAELDPNARPTVVPFAPYPIPVPPPRREQGTDGLMGRLPFDLPPDPPRDRVDRFTIDDIVVVARPLLSTTPAWVRRLGSLSSYRVDPYQR